MVLGLSATRQMGPLTSLTLSGGWQETNFGDGTGTNRTSLSASINRDLGRTLSAQLGVSYVDQSGDASTDEYDEFRATATLNKTF